MKKSVTIKDVAQKAGVSHPTVSRVIHDSSRISEKTKQRVRRVMEQLRYRPNRLARGLVHRESQVLACIVPELNPHVQPILRGVADECRRRDYGLMVFSTEYWTEAEVSYAEVVENWRVDGVLIYNVVYHAALTREVRALQKERVPFVFLNKYLGQKTVNAAGVDNEEAVAQAVNHLHGLGHRRIGLLNGSLMSVDGVERKTGFRRAMERAGLEYDEALAGDANFSDGEAFEETRRILCARRPPTALFCANDLMAMGAVKAIQSRGLRVPRDVSVVGFDDIEAGRWFSPAMSTVRPPLVDIGGKAIDLLVKTIREPGRPAEQIALQAKLVVRESSGPAPRRRRR